MNVGVIGAGAISGIYLENMIRRFKGLQVKAISSAHMESARKKAAEWGLQARTTEEILADPEIEMVVILTSASVHYPLIKEALLNGKHVYSEKTITDDFEQAKELRELAAAKGLYLGCAPDTFLGSALQAARAAIDRGLLGDIHSFVISANRNNTLLLSYAKFLREPKAGALFDYGVYYMTALTSLLGPVKRAFGVTRAPYETYPSLRPEEAGMDIKNVNESQVAAILELQSGVTGTFHQDHDSACIDQAYFAIYGTKGVLYLPDPNQFGGSVRFLPNTKDWDHPEPPVVLEQHTPFSMNSRGVGPADLAQAVREGRPPRASADMAVHVLEVLEAVLNSPENGGFKEMTTTFTRPEPLPEDPEF